MNYYCLVAGLPDLQPENLKNVPSLESLLAELHETLKGKDLELLKLLQQEYDNKNLLAYLANKEAELSLLGTLSAEDLAEGITIMQESDIPKDKRLPVYFPTFYNAVTDEKVEPTLGLHENFLATLYYENGCKCKNKFLSEWFTFCLNLNNILTAYYCRKYNLDIKTNVLGDNDVAKSIKSTNARDFGLTGVIDNLELLFTIAEEPNLLEREKRIDALKWAWLEEQTFFHYFSIERVLAFFIRCQLMQRWSGLTPEEGEKVFRSLLDEMKQQVHFQKTA